MVQATRDTEKVPVCGRAIDLVLVLDTSGSVESVFARQRRLALNITAMLPLNAPRFRTSLVTFSDSAYVELSLAKGESGLGLMRALNNAKYTGGDTATADAVSAAATQLNDYSRYNT